MKKFLSLLLSITILFVMMPSAYAGETRIIIEGSTGGYITITNVIEKKTYKNDIADIIEYTVEAPVTVTFYGDDLFFKNVAAIPNYTRVTIIENKAIISNPGLYHVIAAPQSTSSTSVTLRVIESTETDDTSETKIEQNTQGDSTNNIRSQFTDLYGFNDEQNTFNEGLAWVQLSQYGDMGVIDRQGNVLIDDLFSDQLFRVYLFSEGLSRYQNKQGEWLFLDKYGNEVIKTSYDMVFNFREGLAGGRKDGKWGFINREGKEVIKPQYDEIRDDDGYGFNAGTSGFYEGLAAVNKNGKWGFIDRNGKEVIPPKYDWVNNFNEGLAVVSKNGKWGYINKNGEEVIKVVYDEALNFSEGVASVLRNNNAGNNWMFIDKSGKVIADFKNKYWIVYPPKEGVSIAFYYKDSPDHHYAILDRKGKQLVNFGNKYVELDHFSEGLAWAEKKDGGIVFIDKTGKEVTGIYARAHSSTQGLIGVKRNHSDNYEFIRHPLDIPSTWALAEISVATSLNLVPLEIDYGYNTNITRADFSKLALNLLSVKTGKTVDEMLADAGKKINYERFTDTFDSTVLTANALGIIQGKSSNKLDPDGLITREEAAVMLTRVSGMQGITKGDNAATFDDEKNMASWSKESIAHISSIIDKSNQAAVMGGVGNNKFAPAGNFTKQQAFITMKRLYNAK